MSEDDRQALQRRNFATLGVVSGVAGGAFSHWQGSIAAGIWMTIIIWLVSMLGTEAVNK